MISDYQHLQLCDAVLISLPLESSGTCRNLGSLLSEEPQYTHRMYGHYTVTFIPVPEFVNKRCKGVQGDDAVRA